MKIESIVNRVGHPRLLFLAFSVLGAVAAVALAKIIMALGTVVGWTLVADVGNNVPIGGVAGALAAAIAAAVNRQRGFVYGTGTDPRFPPRFRFLYDDVRTVQGKTSYHVVQPGSPKGWVSGPGLTSTPPPPPPASTRPVQLVDDGTGLTGAQATQGGARG